MEYLKLTDFDQKKRKTCRSYIKMKQFLWLEENKLN